MNDSCITVVEDEVEIAELIEFHAKRDGFRTRVVHSGKTALESLAREIPDVVVLDLMLPDVDGLEVFDAFGAPKPPPTYRCWSSPRRAMNRTWSRASNSGRTTT